MAQPDSLKTSTKVFLVLLRLVIGWHLLFEGVEKFKTDAWTAEPYLRESSGPLAPVFRWMAGDPVKEKLTLAPVAPERNPQDVPLHERFPTALAAEWDAYFDRFLEHYDVKAEQKPYLEIKFVQAKEQYVDWLERDRKDVTWTSPYGPPVTAPKSVAERIALYEEKQAEADAVQNKEYPRTVNTQFEAEEKKKLAELKAEANRVRADLKGDIDARTREMKETLYQALAVDPKLHGVLASVGGVAANEIRPTLVPEPQSAGPLTGATRPALARMSRLDWINESVRWGLLITGALLLLGLFSRPVAVVGAGFLLMFYLALPALPGLPDNPKSEGHYFIVNKNIVELVALLLLATVPTGRWLGIDALFWLLRPGRRGPRQGTLPVARSSAAAAGPIPVPGARKV
jgi:uncharacterized membrane protein YphA (DoxX/SURF4 family)